MTRIAALHQRIAVGHGQVVSATILNADFNTDNLIQFTDQLIALVKQVVRRRACADACHTRNLVVEAGNLFRIVVDLINAGFNRGIDLLILIAQILVGRFKLIHQPISFTD